MRTSAPSTRAARVSMRRATGKTRVRRARVGRRAVKMRRELPGTRRRSSVAMLIPRRTQTRTRRTEDRPVAVTMILTVAVRGVANAVAVPAPSPVAASTRPRMAVKQQHLSPARLTVTVTECQMVGWHPQGKASDLFAKPSPRGHLFPSPQPLLIKLHFPSPPDPRAYSGVPISLGPFPRRPRPCSTPTPRLPQLQTGKAKTTKARPAGFP